MSTVESIARPRRNFFFNDTATTEISTLSLPDALPICSSTGTCAASLSPRCRGSGSKSATARGQRSEEHTSELQSHLNLVCRLLLEKKKVTINETVRDRKIKNLYSSAHIKATPPWRTKD